MNTFEAIHGGENHRLWIGGHRGHASATRENTTANFAEVLGMGVDYIEIDVQLTRDRQAVIFHDMALEERTPLHGHIRDYTVAELKAAFEIDTLEEALAWCKAHGMAVLLEVKSCELLMHEDMPTGAAHCRGAAKGGFLRSVRRLRREPLDSARSLPVGQPLQDRADCAACAG